MKYPKVIAVKPEQNYSIIVTYETGEIKKFDVTPYISGNWFGQLRDKEVFDSVHPCGNTVEWSGGQDIAPHELFEMSVVI